MGMIKYILLFSFIFETFAKSDVYFTKDITPEKIVELYKKLNIKLDGPIGLKIHSGEKNGPYFLRPSFLKDIYNYTNGTFIECNVAYRGSRYTTELHKELLKSNGWSEYKTVILDEYEKNDITLKVDNHHVISENYVGEHLNDFNSCLVLSHFKGHGMGGFGGALKQLSIGFASRAGKTFIHTAGATKDYREVWSKAAKQLDFTASMADAASTIVNYFKNKGGIAYINVLANISKSCDCAGSWAPPPRIRNIGILASLDPVAIDKACYDLIAKENNAGSQEWIKQSESKYGLNTLEKAVEHGLGSLEYNLIDIDNKDESISNQDSTQIAATSNKDSNKIEHESNASSINLTKNESLSSSSAKQDSTQSNDLKETENEEDNKKEDNSFKQILCFVICITVIALILYIIFYMVKKRKKGSLVANEDLGQSTPEEKV